MDDTKGWQQVRDWYIRNGFNHTAEDGIEAIRRTHNDPNKFLQELQSYEANRRSA